MNTVRDVIEQRKGIAPGFGLMRHALSLMILVEHCYIIGLGKLFNVGYEKGDIIHQAHRLTSKQFVIEALRPFMFSLVGSFFVLSGFLVYGSALRNRRLKDFYFLRVIRIVPALSVEVTISALLIGPVVTSYALSAYFSDASFFAYFGNIVGLVRFNLPGVFLNNPTPNWVNGNLWTLPAELECYLFLGALIFIGAVKNRWAFLLNMACATLLIAASAHFGFVALRGSNVAYSPRYIVFLFFCGVCAHMFSDKILLSLPFFVISIFYYYWGTMVGLSDLLCAPALVYAVCYVGCCDFSLFDRWIDGDYSYGIYLYGYPITQTVMFFLKDTFLLDAGAKVVTLACISIPLTCLVAYLSWHFVERKCLKLRNLLIKKTPNMQSGDSAASQEVRP